MTSDRDGAGAEPATEVLLERARAGDRAAYDRLFTRVYAELKAVASNQARRMARHDPRGTSTLATTALVHEVYVKLAGERVVAGADRVHFFALAAGAMRQIVIDRARYAMRKKRDGGRHALALDPLALAEIAHGSEPVAFDDLLALDAALSRLAARDAELARAVELRFFAGLTLAEIAEVVGSSERTLKRNWQVARAFLRREMSPGAPAGSAP